MADKKQTKKSNTPANAGEVLDSMGTSTADPGFVWGVIGLALFFIFPLAGLPVSAIGYSRSKNAGYKNDVALIGLIMNGIVVGLVALAIVFILFFVFIAAIASSAS